MVPSSSATWVRQRIVRGALEVSDVPDHPGDPTEVMDAHVLGIYDTETFLVDAAVDIAGLQDRDDLTLIGLEVFRRAVTSAQGLDAARYQTGTEELLARARDREMALHACGNLHSVLWEAGDIDQLLALEGHWNRRSGVPSVRLLCLYASHVFRGSEGDDRFIALCREHADVRPVEDFASLVDAVDTSPERPVALLEHQARASQRDREHLISRTVDIQADLDRCVAQAADQRGQFDRAVASRDVIGQAKGIIMVRWHLDAAAAFDMLSDASRRSHRKLRDVAAAVVEQQLRLGGRR